MHNTLLLATRNRHKQRELEELLSPLGIKVISLADIPDCPEIEEDGQSFEENAIKKARLTALHTGLTTLADDSGLEVEALGGQPGVYSARFAGEPGDDEANNRKLLRLMKDVPAEQRRARFVCVVAVSDPNGETRTVCGVCEGRIAFGPRGTGGFGYDPLFIPAGYTQSFAELSAEEKNRISHRARALQRLPELFPGWP
ncbi:MAG: XTP/dITP diphosphatase [Syntrophomonadaceae bacterium]|jgi:XTP/dITP diphosphohydrolase|nr:XTP/dITP diphosphatase [Syntrophomonadaceae bacterium]